MADRIERTSIWKGLNRAPYIGDGEMRSMKNLSSDAFPFLTTRKGRKPYTFTTHIPGTPGDGYVADVTELPEPCEEEQGNIYKLVGEFEPGTFYRYTDGAWTKDESVIVITELITSRGEKTMYDGECYTFIDTNTSTTSLGTLYNSASKYVGTMVKYTGESTEQYDKNCIYRYNIKEWREWRETTSAKDRSGDLLPDPNVTSPGVVYKYTGETTEEFVNGTNYKNYHCVQGVWEKVAGYYPVTEALSEPSEEATMLWCGSGLVTNGQYYIVCEDMTADGSAVYFVAKTERTGEAVKVTALPAPSADNLGTTYFYTGASTGGFMECVSDEMGYIWMEVEHPQIERVVTLKDYLDNYDGSGLTEIIEIGVLNGQIATLFKNSEGKIHLFYDKKMWPVTNITDEAGKKLVTVGNKLIVGEAGCYLHIKNADGVASTEFFTVGESFATSFEAHDYTWGNGGEKIKRWIARGYADGKATFKLYTYAGKGTELEMIYEGLKTVGSDFVVYSRRQGKGSAKYLTVDSITWEPNLLIGGWTTGTKWYEDYADVLTITATGVYEDFDWYTAINDTLTFESTDPHYYDVVAWKKRLWAYDSNVMFGTAADIFEAGTGMVDWNRGDNTNMEAVAQPLWQGGSITGIAALMSGLVYFKEDCITVVQGNYPAIMSSNTIPCRGLPLENRRSVTVANEAVYYLSTDGVYRFDGGIPRCISGDVKITGTDAVGASDGNKYWLSLKEPGGEYALYVYDINRGIWHREDKTHAVSFAMLHGEMHMAVGTEIYNLSAPQEDVDWECELWYDEGTYQKKRYKSFNIRGDVGECELYLRADDGEWKLKKAVDGKMLLQLPPFECRELGVKLKGRGKCEIKSLDRTFEVDG